MNLVKSYKKSLTLEINNHIKKLRQQLHMVHPRYVKYIIKQKSVKDDIIQIDTELHIIDHTIESAGKEFLDRYNQLMKATKHSYYSYIISGFVRSCSKVKDKNMIKQNYISAKNQLLEIERKQTTSINYCVTLMNSISKKLEKTTKGTKVMKEATEYQAILDNIDKTKDILYEKCNSGEISLEERELLLEQVNDMIPMILPVSKTEPLTNDNTKMNKSKTEIFYDLLKKELDKNDENKEKEKKAEDTENQNTVKESVIQELYNRHACGDITLEERELLIHKVKLM